MSKWVEVRDSLVDALNVDEVTEELKESVTQKVLEEVLPAVEDVANKFVATIQDQAKTETGWDKARDGIILPLGSVKILSQIHFIRQ